MPDEPKIQAGQIYRQGDFPYTERRVVLIRPIDDDGKCFALLSRGLHMACIDTKPPWEWRYTPEELERKFDELEYSLVRPDDA